MQICSRRLFHKIIPKWLSTPVLLDRAAMFAAKITTMTYRRATLSRDVCHRTDMRDGSANINQWNFYRRKLNGETLNLRLLLSSISFSAYKDQYFDISANKLQLLPSEIIIVRHRGYYEATIQFYRYKYGTRGEWNSFITFASHRWKAKRLKLRAQWGKSEMTEESERERERVGVGKRTGEGKGRKKGQEEKREKVRQRLFTFDLSR